MKKNYILFIVSILICSSLDLSAEVGDIQLGGGFGRSFSNEQNDANALAIDIRANYQWYKLLKLNAYLDYFFVDGRLDAFWSANVDVQVDLTKLDKGLYAYGLIGINTNKFTEAEGERGVSESQEFGLNLGGGVRYNITKTIDAFGELKYNIGGNAQLMLTLGAMFTI